MENTLKEYITELRKIKTDDVKLLVNPLIVSLEKLEQMNGSIGENRAGLIQQALTEATSYLNEIKNPNEQRLAEFKKNNDVLPMFRTNDIVQYLTNLSVSMSRVSSLPELVHPTSPLLTNGRSALTSSLPSALLRPTSPLKPSKTDQMSANCSKTFDHMLLLLLKREMQPQELNELERNILTQYDELATNLVKLVQQRRLESLQGGSCDDDGAMKSSCEK